MRSTRIIATGAAILALVLGACSGSTTSGTGQQAPAATVAPASTGPTTVPFPGVSMPKDLLGVWTANVQREGPTHRPNRGFSLSNGAGIDVGFSR